MDESALHADLRTELAAEFQVIRPLGEGTVGRVLLARETALQRLVAIKVPRPQIAADPTARRRFEREALSAARLSHPNSVTVFRVGHLSSGIPYIVMRYVEGRTLDDVVRSQGPLSEQDTRSVLRQIAAALVEAHGKGIIHRDVRPANVIWTGESGHAVLMDYGLAAIVESGSEVHTQLTRAGQLLGDLDHMSPEQFRGEPVTTATDIYSFGVFAYEILTGAGPYRVAAKSQLGLAHVNDQPLKLSNAGADLAVLLERCLAKRPEHRPSAVDLVRLLSRQPAHASIAHSHTVENIPALRAFVSELERRRVFHIVLLYAGVAFILLQGSELILPSLPLPVWTYDAVVALTLAAFPIALVLGWFFEFNEGRIQRTADPAIAHHAKRTQLLFQVMGIGTSLLLAALIGWWVLGS